MANQKKENFSVKETKPSIRAKKPLTGPSNSFELVEEMLYLYVSIERARGLPVPLLQAELTIGNYRGATSTEAKSPLGEFIWHRVFAFTQSRVQDTSVQVLVKDENNVVVGKCSFAVSDALRRVPPDPPLAAQWYPLVDPQGKFGGQLLMAFWTGTQADEVYSIAAHSDEAAAAALGHEGLSSIRPKVYQAQRLWYLRVNVIAAQDLVIPGINNREHPAWIHVRAILPPRGVTTRPCLTMTPDAKWNEDLMLVVAEPCDEILEVGVFERLPIPTLPSPEQQNNDVLLGLCRIPLKNVAKRTDWSPVSSLWYDLNAMEGEGKNTRFASKINMRISLDGGYHVFDEPTEFSSDFRPSAKVLWKPEVGVFELGILSASGLSSMKAKNNMDTFCVAKYGPKWVKTRTVIGNCSPEWNEQYMWQVYDHCTVITIAVFENNLDNENDYQLGIGKVRIRLSDLDFNKVYTNSHPLVCLGRSGVEKRGELQLSYRFCPKSGFKFNVYYSYSQYLWPKLHYVLPLSVAQIRILRGQAVMLTQERLHRSGLRPEVVEYVLDDDKHRFSLRRARANFLRCVKLFGTFEYYRQQFVQLQRWTNPLLTTVFGIFVHMVTLYPGLSLASMFFMLTGLGAWGYLKRPKQLPRLETELFQVHSAFPDDLERGIPPHIVPMMLNVQILLGDIASAGERVQALMSWRDKKATLIVLIFSLFAGVCFYLYPYRVRYIFLVMIGFKLSHPIFRTGLPSVFHNFMRRMPSKIDGML